MIINVLLPVAFYTDTTLLHFNPILFTNYTFNAKLELAFDMMRSIEGLIGEKLKCKVAFRLPVVSLLCSCSFARVAVEKSNLQMGLLGILTLTFLT